MSATNHTENLGLSQFLGTDKPTWLGDYNSDMEKIDTSIHNLEIGTTSTIAGQIHILEESVKDLISTDATHDVAIQANTSSISALRIDVLKNTQDIDNLDTREQRNYDVLSQSIDSSITEIDEMNLDISYVKKNMEKVENLQIISTVSVSRLQVRMQNAEIDIDNLQNQQGSNTADIAQLKADVNDIDVKIRTHDNSISQAQRNITANTTSIAAIAIKLDTTAADSSTRLDSLETITSSLRQDVDNNETSINGAIQNVTALQNKTENIADGVSVPFGFGTAAGNKRGYEKPDGTIEAFATNADLTNVNDKINTNTTDIATLKTRTSNIAEGKALPYSLAISDGGGYGYIKNGETGVTPFVSQSDIDQIVTIGEKTANIEGSPIISANLRKGLFGHQYSLSANEQDSVTIINDSGQSGTIRLSVAEADLPFSFGIDSNGNYGYIKAGADTVTPFLKMAPIHIMVHTFTNISFEYLQAYDLPAGTYKISIYIEIPITPENIVIHGDMGTVNVHDGTVEFTRKIELMYVTAEYANRNQAVHGYLQNVVTGVTYPF